MTKQPYPQDLAVAAWLEEKKITFTAAHRGEQTRENDWKCDAWAFTFWRPSVDTRGKWLEDMYYTGLGHRELTSMGKIRLRQLGKVPQNFRQRVIDENSKPVAPPPAGILNSILGDARGAEQNFHDWCDEYGYNNDSIKHQRTYNSCCEMLTKVRDFFTRAEREQLEKLLEDY